MTSEPKSLWTRVRQLIIDFFAIVGGIGAVIGIVYLFKDHSMECEHRDYNYVSEVIIDSTSLIPHSGESIKDKLYENRIKVEEIFAIHGYKMQEPEILNRFSKCEWYHDCERTEIQERGWIFNHLLSEVEKINVMLIQRTSLHLTEKPDFSQIAEQEVQKGGEQLQTPQTPHVETSLVQPLKEWNTLPPTIDQDELSIAEIDGKSFDVDNGKGYFRVKRVGKSSVEIEGEYILESIWGLGEVRDKKLYINWINSKSKTILTFDHHFLSVQGKIGVSFYVIDPKSIFLITKTS